MEVMHVPKTTIIKCYPSFTMVSNQILRDPNLNLRDIGLYAKLCSFPDSWRFSERGLAAIIKDGYSSIHTGIQNLEKYGYLKRLRNRDERGRLGDAVWLLTNEPFHFPELNESLHSVMPKRKVTGENGEGDIYEERPDTDDSGLDKFSSLGSGSPDSDKLNQENHNSENRAQYNTILQNNTENKKHKIVIAPQKVISLYNELAVRLRPHTGDPNKIADSIKRLSFTEEEYIDLFCKANRSDFLAGETTDFVASLAWLLKPTNAKKVRACKYDNANTHHVKPFAPKSGATMCQRNYTPEFYAAVERSLLGDEALSERDKEILKDKF